MTLNLPAVERDHVLTAIEQFQAAGGQALLAAHGTAASNVVLHEGGRPYDATVVVGLAHGLATGYTPEPSEVRAQAVRVAQALTRLGFDVEGPPPTAPAPRARRSSTPRTSSSTRRATAPEKPAAICPTCFMALPATGVCDTCG